jgi:hypothetical protein
MANLALSIFAFFVSELVYWAISRLIQDEAKRILFFVVGSILSGAVAALLYLGPISFPTSPSPASTLNPYDIAGTTTSAITGPSLTSIIPIVINTPQYYPVTSYFFRVGDIWYIKILCINCPDDLQIRFNIYRSSQNLMPANPKWEFVERISEASRVLPGYWYRFEAVDVPPGVVVMEHDPKYCCDE